MAMLLPSHFAYYYAKPSYSSPIAAIDQLCVQYAVGEGQHGFS